MAIDTLIGEPCEVKLPVPDALHFNSNPVRFPAIVTEDLAELVGYFMGDGSSHVKGLRFSVDSRDVDVIQRISVLSESLFGIKVSTYPGSGGCTGMTIGSEPLVRWWEQCGFRKLQPHPSHTGKGWIPTVPDAILETNSRKVYGAFLRGLFEADGHSTGGVIEVASVHESFLADCQTMMASIGIVGLLGPRGENGFGHNIMHEVLVISSFKAGFMTDVGFISRRKTASVTSHKLCQCDKIPVEPEMWSRLIGQLDPGQRKQFRHAGLWVTRDLAELMLSLTQDDQLESLLKFFWDTVESVRPAGPRPTFDISVPENKTYVANGFISHNTIAFMMDCDTTGIEPEIGLVKHKTLAGGGDLTIVNQTVGKALRRLGYEEPEIVAIVDHVNKYGHVEDHVVDEGGVKVNQSPCCVRPEHRDIFDCSLPAGPNKRSIPYKAHIQMMAAVQPFISGAISKTVNMPADSTVDDVRNVYIEAWELGLKCVAIYRDGSKRSQPLNVKKMDGKPDGNGHIELAHVARHRLPDTRRSVTHKFNVAGHEGYLTVGLFEDHTPGELFITMAKEGSTVGGLMDTIGTLTSLSLQYGVPLDVMTRKFLHSRFEPSGFTGNPKIRQAASLVDYIYHWLALEFGVKPNGDDDAFETCPQCGHAAQRSGTCHTCPNCGTSLGCS